MCHFTSANLDLSACIKMALRPVHAQALSWDGQLCSGKNNTVWASFCVVVLMEPDWRNFFCKLLKLASHAIGGV